MTSIMNLFSLDGIPLMKQRPNFPKRGVELNNNRSVMMRILGRMLHHNLLEEGYIPIVGEF